MVGRKFWEWLGRPKGVESDADIAAMRPTDRVVLATLGLVDLTYGSAIAVAHKHEIWWPASVEKLLGVPVKWWGVLWIGVGLFLLGGVAGFYPGWRRRLFGTAAAMKVVWAFAAVSFYWESTPHFSVWGPAAVYLGFSVVVLALGWPDTTSEQ